VGETKQELSRGNRAGLRQRTLCAEEEEEVCNVTHVTPTFTQRRYSTPLTGRMIYHTTYPLASAVPQRRVCLYIIQTQPTRSNTVTESQLGIRLKSQLGTRLGLDTAERAVIRDKTLNFIPSLHKVIATITIQYYLSPAPRRQALEQLGAQ